MTHSTDEPAPTHFIGLDVGDRVTHLCVLDAGRQVVERAKFATTREGLYKTFSQRKRCPVVLEVGSQSPWMSAYLKSAGFEVVVADARRVAAITRSGKKTDRRDAETLARLLQGMPELLGSVYHRGEQAQADLSVIRARDSLVQLRTKLILHTRGNVKAFGLRTRSCSAKCFHRVARPAIPELLRPALNPILDTLAELESRIAAFDRQLVRLADERYPEAKHLQQVPGVGPLISMAYVLTMETPRRFSRSRKVGSWIGLCPRVQSSGDKDPQLPISKTGCPYLRRLLVQAAHRVLGHNIPDSDLRRYGERIAERGGKAAKARAVVTVARKLAVLLHRLWVTRESYVPLRCASQAVAGA